MERRSHTAAVYARAASTEQAELAIGQQQRLCADAASRHDADVVASFTDVGTSGLPLERPGLRDLFGWLDWENNEGRKVDYLVVASVDRLARRHEELSHLFHKLGEQGLRVLVAENDSVIEVVLPHRSRGGEGGSDEQS